MEGNAHLGGYQPRRPSQSAFYRCGSRPVAAAMGLTLAKQPRPVSAWRLRSGQVKTRRGSDSGERRLWHTPS
jgi:hypothetical protein